MALGRDPPIVYATPPKPKSPLPGPPGVVCAAVDPSERSVRALTLGEAAARLRLSRAQLEEMVTSGTIQTLPTGFTRMIPTREVERLSEPESY